MVRKLNGLDGTVRSMRNDLQTGGYPFEALVMP